MQGLLNEDIGWLVFGLGFGFAGLGIKAGLCTRWARDLPLSYTPSSGWHLFFFIKIKMTS
jgi:hypothetical protein